MGRKKELKSWRNLGKVGEGRGEGAQANHRNEKWDEGQSEESEALYSSSAHIESKHWGRRAKGEAEEDIRWNNEGKVHARKEGNPHRKKRESKEERDQDKNPFLEQHCLSEQGHREPLRTCMQFVLIMQCVPYMCSAYVIHCKLKWSGVI